MPRDPAGLPGAVPRPVETWLRITQVHDRVRRRVDGALHRTHGLSLIAFETLRRIAGAPGERSSLAALTEAAGSGRSAVTGTVNRLAGEGLVERVDAGDTSSVRLTAAGRHRVAAAARTHDDLVAHLLTLLGDDAVLVTAALARVSAAARR
ncbi:MAG: MarR family winged helix-turn-helix transcriptional regulator [Blastococcus sp.]